MACRKVDLETQDRKAENAMRKASHSEIIAVAALLAALAVTLYAGERLWGLAGVQAVQGLGGWLTWPMRVFTFLGDEQFYLVILPLVYWCLHKELGADLGILLVLTSFTNTGLKSFLKHARPFWETPALRLGDASSFSTPSGHAQNSAALFGQVARFAAKRRWGRLWGALLALLIALVALSRVYLGVHFPGDVLWGMAVGLGLLALYGALKPMLLPRLKRLSLAAHVLLALIGAGIMLAVVWVLLTIPFGSGSTFGALYVEAWNNALEDAATVAGLALGLWIGLVVELHYVKFSVAGPRLQRGLRYLIGILGLFAIWFGLRILFPPEPLVLGLVLRVVRYGLAMFWAIALWPWLFVRVGLGGRA